MKYKYGLLSFLFCVSFVSLATSAAPLDNLSTIENNRSLWNAKLSFSIDRVNETLDVLNIRGQDDEFSGTTVGDYQGYSANTDIMLWQGINLNASIWKRKIDLGSLDSNITTGKIGAQWNFLSQKKHAFQNELIPSMAIRYQYWFNRAGDMTSASSRKLLNITVDEIKISGVNDAQHQIDFVASWDFNPKASFSFFSGLGRSEVSHDKFNVTYNGCQYSFDSPTKDSIILTLDQDVTSSCQISRIKREDSTSPFTGPGLGISYQSNYIQVGSAFNLALGKWGINGGMRYIKMNRDVDAVISDLNKPTSMHNFIGLLAVSRHITKNSILFARGQYYYRNWAGEIPLTYNVFTSHRFSRAYGLMSLGLMLSFG